MKELSKNNQIDFTNVVVSIIIPTYNSSEYISNALNSVLNQTYQNLEVIIIDDGSVDNTIDIIKQFDDERIHLIESSHSGQSGARNTGLNNATGDYIAFLDSDDSFEPNYIEHMLGLAIKHSGDIVIGYVNEANVSRQYYNGIKLLTGQFIIEPLLKDEQPITRPLIIGRLYKSTIFDDIRFPIDCYHEDLYIRSETLLKAESVIITYEALYNRSIREGSLTESSGAKEYAQLISTHITDSENLINKNPDLYLPGASAMICHGLCYVMHKEHIEGTSEEIKYLFQLAKDTSRKYRKAAIPLIYRQRNIFLWMLDKLPVPFARFIYKVKKIFSYKQ